MKDHVSLQIQTLQASSYVLVAFEELLAAEGLVSCDDKH